MKTHSDSQGENEEDGEKKESQKMRNYLVKNLLDSEMSYFECIDMIRKVCVCLMESFNIFSSEMISPGLCLQRMSFLDICIVPTSTYLEQLQHIVIWVPM